MNPIKTFLLVAASLTMLAVGLPAGAAQTEPPPLSEQDQQPTLDHHISPPTCTVIAAGTGNECIEQGERWRCPVRLSAAAVHRGPLTYNETLSPTPPATRWSHCKFVDVETAVPVAASDRNRPVIDCVETYVSGTIVVGRCQTIPPPPVPTATPTPAPTAVPPVAVPVPSFAG